MCEPCRCHRPFKSPIKILTNMDKTRIGTLPPCIGCGRLYTQSRSHAWSCRQPRKARLTHSGGGCTEQRESRKSCLKASFSTCLSHVAQFTPARRIKSLSENPISTPSIICSSFIFSRRVPTWLTLSKGYVLQPTWRQYSYG